MTNNFQRIEFIGRLGRDPVERVDQDAKTWVDFSVCVESFKPGENEGEKIKSLCWINVHVSGKFGTACKRNLSKGRLVYVSGELIYDKYGNPRRSNDDYSTPKFEIMAETVKFLDPANKPEPEPDPIQTTLKGIK